MCCSLVLLRGFTCAIILVPAAWEENQGEIDEEEEEVVEKHEIKSGGKLEGKNARTFIV